MSLRPRAERRSRRQQQQRDALPDLPGGSRHADVPRPDYGAQSGAHEAREGEALIPPPDSPTAWLWAELAARLGEGECEALRRSYNARCASYHKQRRDVPLSPPEQRTPGPKAKQERRIRR
jgi:hypothetical protein